MPVTSIHNKEIEHLAASKCFMKPHLAINLSKITTIQLPTSILVLLIKKRNGMDLTEAEDIKKRWQEYTEELYKKDLQDPDNHNRAITHLEPDIPECEVKWALGSITMNKASGCDGIPAELFSNSER